MRGEGQRVVTPLVNGITCSAVEAAHSCLREWGAAVRAGTGPAPRHDALADDGALRRPRLPGDLGEWQAFRGSPQGGRLRRGLFPPVRRGSTADVVTVVVGTHSSPLAEVFVRHAQVRKIAFTG